MKTLYNLRPLFSIGKNAAQLAQCLAMLAIMAWPSSKLFAQAPAISYSTPQTYTAYVPMTPLSPSNTGGAVTAPGFNASTTTLNTGISDATCVAVGADGKLYIGESSGKVSVFTPGGGPATVLASGFGAVSSISLDPNGNIFLANGNYGYKIDAGSANVTTLGEYPNITSAAADAAGNIYITYSNGLAEFRLGGYSITDVVDAQTLYGITFDALGNVFFGNTGNHSITRINPGTYGQTQISNAITPQALTTDPSGNVYIASASAVYLIPEGQTVPVLVGSGASFNATGIAVDANLNLYLANGTITETQPIGGYFIKPALSQGLTFDMTSGQISGTPGVISANNNYTVTAFNASGNSPAPLAITINAPAVPKIIYFNVPSFNQDVTISPAPPTTLSGGGVVPPPAFNPTVTTVWPGSDFSLGLAMDKAGNLYIGDATAKEILKLPKGSSTPTVFATGFSSVAGVAVDGSGNVYLADPSGAKLWKVPAGGGTAIALGAFNYPYGVATDAAGNVYVADRQSGVYKMAPDGTGQTSLSSSASACVTVDSNGNVFFGDLSGNVDEIPAGGAQKVFNHVGGLFLAITTDASGNVYVISSNVIYMLPAGGGASIQVGPSSFGKGAGGLLVDAAYNLYWMWEGLHKANATGGYFISPELPPGITMDPNSGIITGTPTKSVPLTDHYVTAFNTTGSATAFLPILVVPLPPAISYSTPQTYNVATAITALTPASTGGAVAAPAFNSPTAVTTNLTNIPCLTTDRAGNIYFTELENNTIYLLAPGSSIPTVFASGFGSVYSLIVDASGNLYVADPQAAALWKVPAGGGTAIKLGSFSSPESVGVDAAGNIYVADLSSGIYKMAPDGTGQTSISNITTARHLSVDLNGDLFFLDSSGIVEIPAGGTPKTIYSPAVGHGIGFLAIDVSGNVYFMDREGEIGMLPSGGGTPISLFGDGTAVQGLAVDANFNLYWAKGNIYKANPLGGYYTSPELPAGITIDPTSGVISGTPAVTSAAANYTITAFSATSYGTTTVNIAVNMQLPVISYSTPQNYTAGNTITALTPASTGGAVAVPAFNTAVTTLATGLGSPRGIAMDKAGNIYIGDNSTGNVLELASGAGTPTVFATGFNSIGDVAADASGNVYVADPVGVAIWKIPAGGGTAIRLENSIESGHLALDAAGNIYFTANNGVYKMAPDGTGLTSISTTNSNFISVDLNGNVFFGLATNIYEIPVGGAQKLFCTAPVTVETLTTDVAGNVYFSIKTGVNLYMIPAAGGTPVQFGPSPVVTNAIMVDANFNFYSATTTGTLFKINATGGYFVSPELPNGLNIDPTSGVISGTPVAASAPTNYTITAFNTGGSGAAALNIGINVALPAISYSSPPTFTTGTAITPLTPASTGGAVAAPGFNTSVTTLVTGLGGGYPPTAIDKAGNIYIGSSNGVIYELAPGSSTLSVFAGGFGAPEGLAVDASGNVYLVDGTNQALWKIAPGGASITLGSFPNPNDVAIDAAGNIYVADRSSGVYKMAPDGTGQTSISSTGANFVTVDMNGNVFFNEFSAFGIYEIPSGGVQKTASTSPGGILSLKTDASGNVYALSATANTGYVYLLPAGGGAPMKFALPNSSKNVRGLSVDAGFNLYWADNGALYKTNAAGGYFVSPELPAGLTIDPTTGIISGTPAPSAASAAANYTVTAFNAAGPANATVNMSINLAGPAISYSTPQTYTTGTAITPLMPASTGGAVANPGFNASAIALSAATTDVYTALAMDQAGNIYIGDNTSKQVLELAPGNSSPGIFANSFGSVDGLAVDASGNVYVADAAGASLWKIPAGGGTAVALGSFTAPHGVALDAAGNIYVTNGLTGVYKMAPDGSGQISISSIGSTSISVDLNGNVFFASLNTIYELPAGGVQKTFYNSPNNVQSLTTDASGNVYFATSSGGMYMLPAAGGSPVPAGPQFGPGSAPYGLMLDAGLNLYFTNQGVFKTNATGGYFASPELPKGLTIDPTSGTISGTPAANTAAANYTITGFNAGGSGTAAVNIGVSLSTPAISYSTPQTYLEGVAITPLAPVSSGGAVGGEGFSGPVAFTTGVSDANCVAFDQSGNMFIGENGQVSELYSGTAGAVPIATGFNQISSIAVDPSDNVYVTDGSVWKIPSGGGPTLGLNNWGLAQGITIDGANNIYVADVVNGVFKMAADGSKKIRIDNTPAAFIASDLNGNLIFSASRGSGVYEIPKGGTRQLTPIDGAAALTADLSGNFYVLDFFGALNVLYANGSAPLVVGNVFGGSTITGLAADGHFNLYGMGGNISELTPTGGYFINPELPKGLAIDPASGAVSGTPAVAFAPTNFTIAAFNAAGSGIATVNISMATANDNLSGLRLSAGAVNPGFTAADTTYTASVVNGASAITVTPTASDPNATITVNGQAVKSGQASPSISLSIGSNSIQVAVTASDGTAKKTYTVTVTRQLPNNANLSALQISRGTLTPAFSPGIASYTASVVNGVTAMTITPTTASASATILVNGTEALASGAVSYPIPLAVGANTIQVQVTAPDGITKKTYTIIVTRAGAVNADLSGLKISRGALNPVFSGVVTSYSSGVVNGVSSMTVTPTTADANATVTVNGVMVSSGMASTAIELAVGSDTITTVVTAQDGITTKKYTLVVTRAAGNTDGFDPGISVTKPNETPTLTDDGIVVHQAISPNGDGINDFLQIDNISQYPDNKLSIMNRNGQLIYEAKGYDNSSKAFDGHSNKNGQMQLPGTYFYQLDYTVDGITKHKTGFLILKY